MSAANGIDKEYQHDFADDTVRTYSEIRGLGLPSVRWKEINSNQAGQFFQFMNTADLFIQKNNPCLFIYTPTNKGTLKGLKKDYLFNVGDSKEVEEWARSNLENLTDCNYLVTSQISNPVKDRPSGKFFVGNAISDGKGNLICETFHVPGICNHRQLSQSSPKEEAMDRLLYSEFFVATTIDSLSGPPEIKGSSAKYLDYPAMREIVHQFQFHKGYFEFVRGEHLGNQGIVVTGYERVKFDYFAHKAWREDPSFRALALQQRIYEGI